MEDKGDLLVVHILYTKTSKKRTFRILPNGFGINPVDLYCKFVNLRPKKVTTGGFFLPTDAGNVWYNLWAVTLSERCQQV